MSLSIDLESLYTPIIDGILANSDLQTISAKRIRAGLQAKVDHDISANKEAITDLIMQRFDLVASNPPAKSSPPPVTYKPSVNGTTTNGKRSSPGDSTTNNQHPAKKHKASKSQPSLEDLDRELAARLQAEENGRARSTRGGGSKQRKTPVKKDKVVKKKRKSTAKVRSEDDSDLESGEKEKKEKERKGGFHKPMLLSPPLATLLGHDKLSRPQTVKKIWEHIKANDLQDKSDKRLIICDEQMRAIFKQEKVHMFTMNKILGQNLYDVDEVAGNENTPAVPAVLPVKKLELKREDSESSDTRVPVHIFKPVIPRSISESSDIDGEGEIVEESEESEAD